MPVSRGDAAAAGLERGYAHLPVAFLTWCTRSLLVVSRFLKAVPGIRSQSELLKGGLRRAYAWLLLAARRSPPDDPPAPEPRLQFTAGSVPLPTGWDLDTDRWTRRLLDRGDPAAPFPAWDRVESESDAMRLRGCLPQLAAHYRATGEPRLLDCMGLLLASCVAAAGRKPQWAWDTTNTALRLVSLLHACEILRTVERRLPDQWSGTLGNFLALHEAPLALGSVLEPDGNHALVNAAGRAAFVLLRHADHPLPAVLRQELEQVLAAQFLPDGGHIERSPHYHLQSLALFRLLSDIDAGRHGTTSRPPASARLPLRALAGMVAPDGGLYRFGDVSRSWSGRDSKAEARDVLQWGQHWGEEAECDLSKHFGLVVWEWVVKGHVVRMVADVGPLGNPANPGHGHADALSYCLFLDGEEVVTDPGTFSYCADPVSTWFKLPQAHSTVYWIDTPSHLLSGYYRWRRLVAPPVITTVGAPPHRVLEAVQQWRIGGHGFLHRRRWTAHDAGLTVVDRLESALGERAASRIQLAPGTRVRLERDGSALVQARSGLNLRVSACGNRTTAARPVEGWYAQPYGHRSEAPALEWCLAGDATTRELQLHLAVVV